MIRRADLERVKAALEKAGFVYRHAASLDMFLHSPHAKARDAVRVVFAGERIRKDYLLPAADVTESERFRDYNALSLEALVRMKLTSFRDKDRTHLRDLLEVGQIDQSWCARFMPELAARLQMLVATPDG